MINIPIEDLIKNSRNREELSRLLSEIEKSLNNWEYTWYEFLSAPLREELLGKLKIIQDVHSISDGGYPMAERQRIYCSRKKIEKDSLDPHKYLKGLNVAGNFLFTKVSCKEFREEIINLGFSNSDIGDIWTQGDRGAQIICKPDLADHLNKKIIEIKKVEAVFTSISLDQLNLPPIRSKRKLTSVEASKRIDAIASSGFGISRSKAVKHINNGQLRLNWREINRASIELSVNDKLQLENRGSIQILSIQETKRKRWRVEILKE